MSNQDIEIFEFDDTDLYGFLEELTFNDLLELDLDTINHLKGHEPDLILQIVEEACIDDIDDRIFYKNLFKLPYNEEEEDYLNWEDQVNDDLGLPVMNDFELSII